MTLQEAIAVCLYLESNHMAAQFNHEKAVEAWDIICKEAFRVLGPKPPRSVVE